MEIVYHYIYIHKSLGFIFTSNQILKRNITVNHSRTCHEWILIIHHFLLHTCINNQESRAYSCVSKITLALFFKMAHGSMKVSLLLEINMSTNNNATINVWCGLRRSLKCQLLLMTMSITRVIKNITPTNKICPFLRIVNFETL